MLERALQAVQTLFAYSDQVLSYTDATSFAVMRRLGIPYVLAFDEDFAVVGFTNIHQVLRSTTIRLSATRMSMMNIYPCHLHYRLPPEP